MVVAPYASMIGFDPNVAPVVVAPYASMIGFDLNVRSVVANVSVSMGSGNP